MFVDVFVRLFLGVFDASVVAVEGQLCVRGFEFVIFLRSVFLGHGVFVRLRIDADDVFVAFFRK